MAEDREVTTKDIVPIPEREQGQAKGPELKLGDFSGPLDLLFFLIEKNEIDLFDIPVAELTAQYMSYLNDLSDLDLDLASDFLVTGAALIELKSRLMLPRQEEDGPKTDPRDELVLRLLAYRRCKLIAQGLQEREKRYAGVIFRVPENPARLGLKPQDPTLIYADETEFRAERFRRARDQVRSRNEARFQDLSEKMDYIVSREQLNLKTWMSKLWQRLKRGVKLSFDRLFPSADGRQKRLTGFLAVLELLKQNKITARQQGPFADIELTRREGGQDGTGEE